MSWGFNNPCYNCKKQDVCPDRKHVESSIADIHRDPAHATDGGSGSVVLMCVKVDAKFK